VSHSIVDSEQLGTNPLTWPAQAEESAGGGPPSPPRGRGALSAIIWDRTIARNENPVSRIRGFGGLGLSTGPGKKPQAAEPGVRDTRSKAGVHPNGIELNPKRMTQQ